MSTKIHAIHLQRDAYVYVRQSPGHQVRAHPESHRRQYALADQARALGFAQVRVIDTTWKVMSQISDTLKNSCFEIKGLRKQH